MAGQQAPVKVRERTKEKVRYLAAVSDANQSDIVERAGDEYIARHSDELRDGIERARAALQAGPSAEAAVIRGA